MFGGCYIIGGLTANFLGPFQFLAVVREQGPWIHRENGRVHMAGILIGSLNAVYVTFISLCRPIGQFAFASLGSVWLG